MFHSRLIGLGFAFLLMAACADRQIPTEPLAPSESVLQLSTTDVRVVPPSECFVNAGGRLSGGDSFGGVAQVLPGAGVRGSWTHIALTGDRLIGTVEALSCTSDGGGGPSGPPPGTTAAMVDVTGSATWNGESGYTFVLHLEDRGEPNTRDYYVIVVEGREGETVYHAEGYLASGNVQIHPSTPAQ